jgi:tRNA pseudouridine32 synthase/23S rRNA pseudouridine746 synthase/23S rRNA pseudouridine1911/1915/1917 synthase
LEILYEDRDILVVNKEAGLLTMSYRRGEMRTAEGVLNNYLRKGCARSHARVYLVHRLDRDTSGLLLFAKSAASQQRLKDDWKHTEKLYLAAVHGRVRPPTGILTSYLVEDEDQFVQSVAEPGRGRLSQTQYEVIKETAWCSVLKIKLLTGRKNQIRVQFAERGHPVVGDLKYGRPDAARGQLALHAKSLAFNHPPRGERMVFTTEIPARFHGLAADLDEQDWGKS